MKTQLESGRRLLYLSGWITGVFILSMPVVAIADPPDAPGVGGLATKQ